MNNGLKWVKQRNNDSWKIVGKYIETWEWKNGTTNYSSEEGVTYH